MKDINNKKVCILLAAYNGERYIAQQVESIISQTYKNWELIIRDDNSTDNTIQILEKFSKKDKRIQILCSKGGNLGPFGNFYKLTEYAYEKYDPDYVLYSDQDDFWFENKIEILLKELIKVTAKNTDKPILIHSNFQLADKFLNHMDINNSRDNVKKMNNKSSFVNLIFANSVYGCTTIVNKLLLKKILEVYIYCNNFDHWMALNASCYGEIFYLNKKLMLYRQHDQNVTGSFLTRKTYCKRILNIISELKRNSKFLLNEIIVLDYFRGINNKNLFHKTEASTNSIIVSKKIITYCIKNRIYCDSIHATLFFYLSLLFGLLSGFKYEQKQSTQFYQIQKLR